MILYSLIIPNRNRPELLEALLASIPVREDTEIIIVDDNSDQAVLENYPGRDRPDTTIIYTKEGYGAGYARNRGLEVAQGRWLVFSDSDDRFITDAYCAALDRYADSDADIVFLNARWIDVDTGKELRFTFRESFAQSDPDRFERKLRYDTYAPWGKLYKRSLIVDNGLKFSEVPMGNDLLFSSMAGWYAKSILVDYTPVYEWIVRNKGNISANVSLEAAEVKLEQERQRCDFLRKHGVKMRNSYLYFRAYPLFLSTGMTRRQAADRSVACLPKRERLPFYLFSRIFLLKKLIYPTPVLYTETY